MQIKAESQPRLRNAILCALVLTGLPGCDDDSIDGLEVPRAEATQGRHQTPLTFLEVGLGNSGIDYARAPSTTAAIFDAQKAGTLEDPPTYYTGADFPITPEKSNGAPGVAILDYDGDGDLDIYATNGPGRANSLFSNQLEETGDAVFEDVGVSAGVGAADMDSTGVCFGDIDNDGDEDLYVLGRMEPNRLFENQGDGTFVDVSPTSGTGGGALGHTSCSMGDVDNDGFLDIAVANSFDWTQRFAIFVDDFASSHANQLFLNQGGNTFTDVSASSGLLDLRGFSDGSEGRATITWGIGLADVDGDGDVDIVQADDQAAKVNSVYIDPNTGLPGVDRGFMHVLLNDGTGHFTDITPEAGLTQPGQWMGVTFGDYDCDGDVDFFGTNMGGYAFSVLPISYAIEETNARWFLNNGDDTYAVPGVGDLASNPFGWGPSSLDYDNDGDADIMYFGSLDGTGPVGTADNPGVLLRNEGCSANFTADLIALSGTAHRNRNVSGSAVGDLDGNGFVDIISVSASDYFDAPLVPYPAAWGSPYDATAAFFPTFSQVEPGAFVWNGFEQTEGSLSVQLNSGGNMNRWVRVRTTGMAGLTTNGSVNRDGIGAVVSFQPKSGERTSRPVVAGSNYASQDALEAVFGLGRDAKGTVDVLWPGGVHNRLYRAKWGETIAFPEIPCDFMDGSVDYTTYRACVEDAVAELHDLGVLSNSERARFRTSALQAYLAEHP